MNYIIFIVAMIVSSVYGRGSEVSNDCQYRYLGRCNTMSVIPCPTGSTCTISLFPIRSSCCKDKPVEDACPPPSGLAGICLFDPDKNCVGDEFCPSGQLCCSEGCGRVCKPALGSIPISTGPLP